MHCPTCDKHSTPVGELEPGQGVVTRCGNGECRARLPTAPVAASRAPAAAAQGLQLVAVGQSQPANVVPAAQPTSMPHAPVQQGAPSSEPIGAGVIQDLARARLSFVDNEIKRLESYRDERTALRRMLGAVDSN